MSVPESILQSVFGLQQFRPHQRQIIDDVLAGRDVVCVMPTGAGKSLCFQLPAVMHGGLTLVVSPLISLMADQVIQLRRLKIPAMLLNSSQSSQEQRDVLSALHKGFNGLLYVAPERFAAPSFQNLLPKLRPSLFVVDEAHCVSFWGHDFRPEYMNLAEAGKKLGSPVTMALTATATPQVRGDIVAMLGLRSPQMHVTGFDRPNLAYSCQRWESEVEKNAAVLRFVSARQGGGIVYCSTRKAVEQVSEILEEKLPGRTVCAYHAGMQQGVRRHSQARFMADANSIAVATNAFGMGINKPDIRYVVHYNLPGTLEAYYQEAGRAGRDGAPAECALLYGTRDLKTQEFFIDKIGDNNESLKPMEVSRLQEHSRRKLDLMWAYGNKPRCRRRQILDYFGEATAITGCRCDVCMKPAASTQHWEPPKPMYKPERFREPKRATRSMVTTMDPLSNARFERLKRVRMELAKELSLPAFCVMHDSVLREVAAMAPRTIAELRRIKGIGAVKAERFGDAFLETLRRD